MRNKSLLLLMVCVVSIFSLVSNPPPAHAQAEPTLIYTTGFETDPASLFLPSYAYGESSSYQDSWGATCGVESSGCLEQPVEFLQFAGSTRYKIIDYFVNTPSSVPPEPQAWEECVVNYAEFDVYYHLETGDPTGVGSFEFSFAVDSDNGAGFNGPTSGNDYAYRQDYDIEAQPGAAQDEWFHVSVPLDNEAVRNVWVMRWRLGYEGLTEEADPDIDLELRIDNLNVWCDYDQRMVRPLAVMDEHPQWELFDPGYVESIDPEIYDDLHYWTYGFSQGFHIPVHSAAPGTVLDITPFSAEKCEQNIIMQVITGLFGEQPQCYIFIPNVITNDANELYRLDLQNAYLVVVDIGGAHIEYIVANAPDYIDKGMEINEGCVIGETIQLLRLVPGEVSSLAASLAAGTGGVGAEFGGSITPVSTTTNNGWVGERLMVTDSDQRIFPLLERYPLNDAPCGTDPAYSNCLGEDPRLRIADGDGRTTQGNVTFDNPGYTLLSQDASIREMYALEAETQYALTVEVEIVDPRPRVELSIGTTTQKFNPTGSLGDVVTLVIDPDTHVADLTDYWTVRILNLSDAAIKIVSICVSESALSGIPPTCYFGNPTFNKGSEGWVVSEGVVDREGSIGVPDDGTFSQEMDLEPGDYRLQVNVYVWYDGTIETQETSVDDTISIEYEFPDGDGYTALTGPGGAEDVELSVFWEGAKNHTGSVYVETYFAEFTIATVTDDTFNMRAIVNSETEGIYGAGIDLACLRLVGDAGEVFGDSCSEVIAPQDQLLSSWTTWLWKNFDGFFQCDLMVVLRKIRDITFEIYRLTGWSMRYAKALSFYQADWMETRLFPWLNGHFNNLASNAGVYYINNQSGGGTNLWDFLVALLQYVIMPLINAAAALLGVVMVGVFGLIAIFLSQVFGIISQLIAVIGAIVAGWQGATPQSIPGFPSCAVDPTTNILCIPLYILENTIFEPGTPGEIMLTLIVAWGSIELLFWVMGSIRSALMEASQSI